MMMSPLKAMRTRQAQPEMQQLLCPLCAVQRTLPSPLAINHVCVSGSRPSAPSPARALGVSSLATQGKIPVCKRTAELGSLSLLI